MGKFIGVDHHESDCGTEREEVSNNQELNLTRPSSDLEHPKVVPTSGFGHLQSQSPVAQSDQGI